MADEFLEKLSQPKLTESDIPEHGNALSINPDNLNLINSQIGGHFRIHSKIAEGGMGSIYKGVDENSDSTVAVKTVLPRLVHDKVSRKRFLQEAESASKLNHPNICSVREYGISDTGIPFLVMDYLEGENLADMIKRSNKLSAKDTVAIMLQIVNALAYAHAQGVIHRDIKPSNIFLTKNEDGTYLARLLDFGIAKFASEESSSSELTKTGEFFGTPLYMSPEQCTGLEVDTRSDIYSLGCVMFECLSGKPPVNGKSSLEIIVNHANGKISDFKGENIPASLKSIVMKTLKERSKRYQNMSELKNDLRKPLDGLSFEGMKFYFHYYSNNLTLNLILCTLLLVIFNTWILMHGTSAISVFVMAVIGIPLFLNTFIVIFRERFHQDKFMKPSVVIPGVILTMAVVGNLFVSMYISSNPPVQNVNSVQHKEEPRKSDKELLAAIAKDPNDYESICDLAINYAWDRKYDEAEKLLKRSLELKPDHAASLANMGFVLQQKSKFDKAEEFYKRAVHYSPYYPSAWKCLGDLYNQMGRTKEAQEAWNMAKTQSEYQKNREYIGADK